MYHRVTSACALLILMVGFGGCNKPEQPNQAPHQTESSVSQDAGALDLAIDPNQLAKVKQRLSGLSARNIIPSALTASDVDALAVQVTKTVATANAVRRGELPADRLTTESSKLDLMFRDHVGLSYAEFLRLQVP